MAEGQTGGESEGLSGVVKAAILANAVGEEAAAELLRHLDPREVQRVALAIKELEAVPQSQVEAVVGSFLQSVGYYSGLGMDADQYLRKVLVLAHGEEKAANILDRMSLAEDAEGLENLKWMDARQIAEVIRDEHPQIKAIVLSYLEPDQAADVLTALPAGMRADLVRRVATLEAVQPAALRELNASLEDQITGARNLQSASVGGIKSAANMLTFIKPELEAELMEQLRELDEELGQEIQDLMFTFDNLGDLDGPAIQTLLREVSSESLLLALKGADVALREKFFSNMSRRAAEMLRDDLDAKGPVRVSEVEAARKEILTIARRLAEEGQIMLGGSGGDEFI